MAYQIAFRMKLEAMKTQGTSIKGVTADTIKAMVLDIPPLEEQKRLQICLPLLTLISRELFASWIFSCYEEGVVAAALYMKSCCI